VSLYLCKREEVNEDKETALNHCCEISKKIVLNLLTCIPIYLWDVVWGLVAVTFVEALSLISSACSASCNGHSWRRIMRMGAHAVQFQLCFFKYSTRSIVTIFAEEISQGIISCLHQILEALTDNCVVCKNIDMKLALLAEFSVTKVACAWRTLANRVLV